MKRKGEDFTIKDFFGIFVPKIWIILLVSVVVAAIFGGYSAFLTEDTYTSDASLIMSKQSYSNSGDIDFVYKMLDACIEVINKENFLIKVSTMAKEKYADLALEGGWDLSTSKISSATNIKKLNSTQVFDIIVTTDDPMLSFAIADCVSNAIYEELPGLLPYPKGTIEFTIVEDASIPSAANSRNVVRNSIIGFAIGLVVALIAVFIFSVIDVVIRDKKKLVDNFEAPVLGVIPDFEIDIGA